MEKLCPKCGRAMTIESRTNIKDDLYKVEILHDDGDENNVCKFEERYPSDDDDSSSGHD